MRQRSLLPDGDYAFGTGLPFLADSPECVAQAILTRLRLATKEWFLDLADGTPYDDQILGHNTGATRDLAVRNRILDTPGVKQISNYASFVTSDRDMTVIAMVETAYGKAVVAATL